jgi:hypothetical protein
MKGLFLVLLLVGCGSDQTDDSAVSPPQETVTSQTTQKTTDAAEASEPDSDAAETVTTPTLKEKYYVRFYYVAEDEQVNATTCAIKTVGLAMEYQMKNLTKEKFDLLSARTYCEVTRIDEYATSKDYELRCNLTDNYMYLDTTCGASQTVQYKHYYRPSLESWGTSAMPDPGYAYGGTSK